MWLHGTVIDCWKNGTYDVKFQDHSIIKGMSPERLVKEETFHERMKNLPDGIHAANLQMLQKFGTTVDFLLNQI